MAWFTVQSRVGKIALLVLALAAIVILIIVPRQKPEAPAPRIDYPDTDNVVMEGVTIEIRKDGQVMIIRTPRLEIKQKE